MTHKCSNCGFRSADGTFFRQARGGLLSRPTTVCEACTPYKPTPYEHRSGLRVLFAPFGFLLGATPLLFHDGNVFTFMLVMAVTSVPTLPLRILIHEAGHAFAARLMGQVVWQARVGSGPIRRRLRLGRVAFEIRAYPWMGGIVKFFGPSKPASRPAEAFIIAAGPLANILAAVVAFGLSYLCQGVGIIAAAFAGFGLFNLLVAVFNLIPRRSGDDESVASDGRQLLNILKPRATPNPLLRRIHVAAGYSYLGRYDDAVATAKQDWQASPLKLFFATQILHNLSRGQGERAAIDFYLAHEGEFADKVDTDVEKRSSLAWVWANVAWSAVKSGDPAFSHLASRLAEAAFAAVPANPEISGTYAAWLISVGREEEGLSRLVQAARVIDNDIDKADFCRFIAQGWRQKGDQHRAAQYDALHAHLKPTP